LLSVKNWLLDSFKPFQPAKFGFGTAVRYKPIRTCITLCEEVPQPLNDLLNAAGSDDNKDEDEKETLAEGGEASEERFREIKKESAGSDQTPAEKRFDELKEEAKEEFVERQKQREQEEQEESEDDDEPEFITY
jgi:hypothetical protein